MAENKHTPEPWFVEKRSQWGVLAHELPRGGARRRIAVCGSPRAYADSVLDGEDEANARLIAAAPEMLAALQDIVKRNEIQNWFNTDKARAAIAKALEN